MYQESVVQKPAASGAKFLHPVALGLILFGLAACASTPEPPTRELQAAELAISNAEQARVADYAATDMDQARRKLASAKVAVTDEEMDLAQRLAIEAQVSADLASAKTEMLKAKEVNDEMQDSIDALTQETQRNSGARQ